MDPKLTWWILLSCLTRQVCLQPHLSKQVLALVATDDNPKCFTRDLDSFTCFWEAPVGKSYSFFYSIDDDYNEECKVTQETNEDEKTALYICSFPPSDVFLYIETEVKVVERDTDTVVYSRNVSVEDQLLLYPPSNISLHLTGEVGQMLVEWERSKMMGTGQRAQYELRYSSNSKESTVILASGSSHKLTSLVAGENCTVHLRVRPYPRRGFWSDWSGPVTAMVPQSAGDIKLHCRTSDLQQVLCKWSEELYADDRYNLHYTQRNGSKWNEWKLCSEDHNIINQCVLHGEESTVYQVYLSAGSQPFGRKFYMKTFNMNNSIQTEPPNELQAQMEGGRLCLKWNPALPRISQHLMYEIRYQLQGENEWKLFTAPSFKTRTCLDVQRGSQYTVQVKAQPNGSMYSGHWSDWSEPLLVHSPLGKEWIFIVFIPVALLIITSAMISSFSKYFGKVKKSLWPSVPNLNKVLESFLTDISGSQWEPTLNIKQCDDDTATSVVEILCEKDVSAVGNPCKGSTCLPVPERSLLAGGNDAENIGEGLEMAQDYVILSNDMIPCFTGNDYVCGDVTSSHRAFEKLHCRPKVCSSAFPECTTNILNHSYLVLSEQSERPEYHSACRYTNMEITAITRVASGE